MPSGERNKRNSSVEEFDIFWGVKCAVCVYKSRAETHERFYMIEAHRHRFEMFARKVPFEKRTRWRKACGRSAKDQIGDIYLLNFFLRFRAKGSRRCAKDVSTRAMSCPKRAAFSHAWYWSKGKEATYHNDILVASSLFDIWFPIRILDFGKCNPIWDRERRRKIRERFAKGGVPGNFYWAQFPYIYIWIYIYVLYIHEPP